MTAAPDIGGPSPAVDASKPRFAVVGAGAVGGYFGGLLARAGYPTVMIGRERFVAAVAARGLVLDTLKFKGTVKVEASTQLSAAVGADYVLFCVKTPDTVETARELSPFLSQATTVVSLQNGAENAAQIGEVIGRSVISAVVYLAAAVPEPGTVRHSGRGDLIIGPTGPRGSELSTLFRSAGIGCLVTDQIEGPIWEKLICNCSLNALSALCELTYGELAGREIPWELVELVVKESLSVAYAAGIEPTNMQNVDSGIATVRRLTQQIAAAYSSTAQDLWRNRRTEIDTLNGFIVRRGQELGVQTPVNHTLWALVKAAELGNRGSRRLALNA